MIISCLKVDDNECEQVAFADWINDMFKEDTVSWTFNDNIMIVISMELIIHMILIMIDGQNDDNDLTLWKGCEPQTSTEERRFRHVWEDGRWNSSLQGDDFDEKDEQDEKNEEDEEDEDGHIWEVWRN